MRDIDQALTPVMPSKPQARHETRGRVFQGIPGVEVSKSGKLFATWYGGGTTEGPENYVVFSESEDGGKSWSEQWIVEPQGHVRAYDPTLWIDPKGRLWWFWAQCYSRTEGNIFDGRAGVWAVIADNPDSIKWSQPLRIANGVMMNKPLPLSNGDWAFPAAVWQDLGGANALPELQKEKLSGLTVSKDEGKTFSFRGGAEMPFRCFDEHHCVELKDGRLWMLVRTFYGIGQSFSTDMGKSWSPGWDSLLGGPNSRIFIRRLKSGRLLLVNHIVDPMNPSCRKDLAAKLSEDDGKSWLGCLLLDEREEVSYPDGAQASDGSIWIAYDHARYKTGDILLAHFTEEDILAGRLSSEKSQLRVKVSCFKS